MNHWAELGLAVFLAAIILAAAWRLFAIYLRRRRWKLLTTSDPSLHVARQRIGLKEQLPDEE
jgi:hypothetical protein